MLRPPNIAAKKRTVNTCWDRKSTTLPHVLYLAGSTMFGLKFVALRSCLSPNRKEPPPRSSSATRLQYLAHAVTHSSVSNQKRSSVPTEAAAEKTVSAAFWAFSSSGFQGIVPPLTVVTPQIHWLWRNNVVRGLRLRVGKVVFAPGSRTIL